MKYIKFTECNTWEGETWSVFASESKLTERLCKLIDSWHDKTKDFDIGLSYEKGFEKAKANTLVDNSPVGYMARYSFGEVNKNLLEELENIDVDEALKKEDWDALTLNYKMSIFRGDDD